MILMGISRHVDAGYEEAIAMTAHGSKRSFVGLGINIRHL